MKKLIVFMLAAILVSCSHQETLKVKPKEYKEESKKKDSSESYKNNRYIIVPVSKSTIVIRKPTRLD